MVRPKKKNYIVESAGPCLEGELVECYPHLTVHSFVRCRWKCLRGELLLETAAEETARHRHVGERNRWVHHVGCPHGVGFGRERQPGEVMMASHLELGRFGNAFEVRDRNVEAGLYAGAGGVMIACSLRPHPELCLPRAAEALLRVVGGGRVVVGGGGIGAIRLGIILAGRVRLLVRHQVAFERELEATFALDRLPAQLLVVTHINLHLHSEI